MILLPKSTFNEATEVGINSLQLQPHTSPLNTGAELDLIKNGSFMNEWLSIINKQLLPRLHTAMNNPILFSGTIKLLVKIREF